MKLIPFREKQFKTEVNGGLSPFVEDKQSDKCYALVFSVEFVMSESCAEWA